MVVTEGLHESSGPRLPRLPFLAARTFSLLYRGIVFCGSPASSSVREDADGMPITNRRYGRLKVCVTVISLAARAS